MRASLSAYLFACLVLATSLPAVNAITLNQFQPIDGFSQACVNAYNTPLSGCTASDFKQGSCSTTCIAFLEALTQVLNANCGGTSAYPNTLIGSFFQNEGTSQLCPNIMSGNGGSGGGVTTGFIGATTYALDPNPSTSTYTPLSFTTATLPLLSAAPTTSTSSTTPSSSSASAAATTTQIAIINTTVVPNTPSASASSSSTGHSRTKASSTSSSSSSTATSGKGDNSGGSPLDVGSSSSASNYNTMIQVWILSLMVGSAGLLLIV